MAEVKEGGPAGADHEPANRTLGGLISELADVEAPAGADLRRITGITTRSGDVRPGSLFIAVRGTSTDGHEFIEEAVGKGAAAVVVERDFTGDPSVPVIRADDTRRAAAGIAAAWHGHPAGKLRLVGITGSIGKTSILAMLQAILAEAGVGAGTVGSLGVHIDGEPRGDTGHTAPGPLLLQQELARIVDEGCSLAAMEVTSHALVQDRVHGLRFDLGIFTNLVPLEHSEYHDTFRDYADAKRLFFDHLKPAAPLIFNIDSLPVRRLVHDSDALPVGCGAGRAATARLEPSAMDVQGSRFELTVRRPLPRVGGGKVPEQVVPIELRLLGFSNIGNAALAVTAALCLGIDPQPIRSALARLDPQPRRLQVLHHGRFLVLDDTVGHPDSISALFQVVQQFEPRRVHIAFAVRGQRGPRVNRHTAEALAVWARQVPLGTLVITRSAEAADERNQVEPDELDAVESALSRHGVAYHTDHRLDAAVRAVLEAADDGDLVLLLGAQGMDAGHEVAARWLEERARC